MILVNEKVEHISYGFGVVTEEEENRISVEFEEGTGSKDFIYPDAFEKFLKAVNPEVENSVIEELHVKHQELEFERLERKREAEELEEKRLRQATTKKRAIRKVKQKV